MRTLLCLLAFASPLLAGPLLVEDGQPRAEIVIADPPLRTVRLAAQELQDGIAKISGAHLPIVRKPTPGTTHLFVGLGGPAAALGVDLNGVKDGGFRLVSGEDWLVLAGLDTEFTPIEPWAKSNQDLRTGKTQGEWNAITGADWGLPNALLYKERFTVPADTGLPDPERTGGKAKLELWSYDERGSFNAVCSFLMKLGMRWYAPGDLGEIVPHLRTIPLPRLNETILPDLPMRRINIRFGVHGPDMAKWAMRLGLREPYGFEIAHGMAQMTDRREVFAAHPEWFAMYGGKRVFQEGANNHLCYSNEGLIAETVKRVRAELDHYHLDAVSIMPPDGYTAICQCDLCKGKDSPGRDQRGLASDYIWGFVNRVAKEVAKTHPDKHVVNCAYGIYSLPPETIAKLEPNVIVGIVGGRRLTSDMPEEIEALRKWREDWQAKSANPIFVFENYPFTDRGWYLPTYNPRATGASINATKGISQGEDIWLSVPMDFATNGIGFNHYLVWFTARMWWGGKQADPDALWREYVDLFYGPAATEMAAFFTYCEANWRDMEKEKDKADTALALFDKAKQKADSASLYGQRIAMVDDYLKSLRHKAQQLGRLRGPVPVLRLVQDPSEKIIIDGHLDENSWVHCPVASTGRLRELQTGRPAVFGTTVKSFWMGKDLYLAFRCDEHRGEKPHVTATKNDDSALWYGDAVEVLIETESNAYYQIAISPNGMIADLDRSAPKDRWFSWNSNAEVATRIEEDHWTVEMRLPITEDGNDPLHQVIGRKPTKSLPWHINLCRQRLREDGVELSAFSPTGAEDFHHPMKFATFYDGNSFQFDHGPPDDDFLFALQKAAALPAKEALPAYLAIADGPYTDFQKTHALETAARLAAGQRQPELAAQLIARFPILAARKSAQMRQLLDAGKASQLLEQYRDEAIGAWPFWKRGEGFAARGRAYAITKQGTPAEADLTTALEWISDPRQRDDVLLSLAQNAANNLHDENAALSRYHEIIDPAPQLGSSTQFEAVHGFATILSKRGQHDAALAVLQRVDFEKTGGFWRDQFRFWIAQTLQDAGKTDLAKASYEAILKDASTDPRLRKVIEEALHTENPH